MKRVLFVNWGRRSLSHFTLELTRAALVNPRLDATISISRQSVTFDNYADFADRILPVSTFASGSGAALMAWRIAILRRQLARHIRETGKTDVIELMPHVWSPAVMGAVKRAGARYCVLAHDAAQHPGDRTSRANALLARTFRMADTVIALSSSVGGQLGNVHGIPDSAIRVLFHPDLAYTTGPGRAARRADKPLRLLFFGRIMPYKGLSLFVDTMEELRRRGVAIEIGVMGEGDLGPEEARLAALGAEVANRWLSETDVAAALARYDVMVLSHIEASQSGVAAAALGSGLPVVSTAVGGLREQVIEGVTGALAERFDASSLADAVQRLEKSYVAIAARIAANAETRSMAHFVDCCLDAIERPT
jgi:glycosyltransferase involved in cell wall biosynthesis